MLALRFLISVLVVVVTFASEMQTIRAFVPEKCSVVSKVGDKVIICSFNLRFCYFADLFTDATPAVHALHGIHWRIVANWKERCHLLSWSATSYKLIIFVPRTGEVFDSSLKRGVPFDFPLGAGRVIKGWDQGLVGMCVGEKRTLIIPPSMGYGDRGAGGSIPGITNPPLQSSFVWHTLSTRWRYTQVWRRAAFYWVEARSLVLLQYVVWTSKRLRGISM